jgi:hypothetical protein
LLSFALLDGFPKEKVPVRSAHAKSTCVQNWSMGGPKVNQSSLNVNSDF